MGHCPLAGKQSERLLLAMQAGSEAGLAAARQLWPHLAAIREQEDAAAQPLADPALLQQLLDALGGLLHSR